MDFSHIFEWNQETKQFEGFAENMSEDDENAEYDVGSEEVFPLNPDSADLCAIGRTKSPKSNQGENMPPGGIIVITGEGSVYISESPFLIPLF